MGANTINVALPRAHTQGMDEVEIMRLAVETADQVAETRGLFACDVRPNGQTDDWLFFIAEGLAL